MENRLRTFSYLLYTEQGRDLISLLSRNLFGICETVRLCRFLNNFDHLELFLDTLRNLFPFLQFEKRKNTHVRGLVLVKLEAEACNFT